MQPRESLQSRRLHTMQGILFRFHSRDFSIPQKSFHFSIILFIALVFWCYRAKRDIINL